MNEDNVAITPEPSTATDLATATELETRTALADLPSLRTKPRRHFPFTARHPWVHAHALASSDAVAGVGKAEADLKCGDEIQLLDHDGNFIGRGLINPNSRLRVRMLSFEQDMPINDSLLANRIGAAIQRRRLGRNIASEGGERLVFSESDGLSGLIVDRYADCLSVQFTAAALLARGEFLIDQLVSHCESVGVPIRKVVARMDATTVKQEGVSENDLMQMQSWQRGALSDELVWYRHNGLWMAVDLCGGQKTGGYLDQQVNHAAAASWMRGRRVLDICTYTGGFALAAAAGGAEEVIAVDSSQRALDLARLNIDRNELPQITTVAGDCFDDLKDRGQRGERFDAVILDPPRFAGSRHNIDAAVRAYQRLNASAVELIRPGGILVTCSCSGRVSRADFLNMLVDVGRRCRRDLVVLQTLGAAPDHPFAVACPESDYLKCVIAQVQ